jgi:F0F1-type ATP synthase membrane subunit a
MHLLLAAGDPLDDVLPHTYFHIGPLGVTNHMLMALIAALLMLWIFPKLFKTADSSAPTGAKNFFESILEFLRVEVFRPALKERTDQFVPFLWTLFFFILFCNVLGALPLASFIELVTWGHIEHFGGPATGAVSTTAALALCAFIFIHAKGIDTVAKSLQDGTYGHHEHHEEHSSNGEPGHEAAHDIEHMRGDALPADVPADFRAVGDPTHHYNDDQYPHRVAHAQHAAEAPGKKMSPLEALLLAVPFYLWNFAPHPFKPKPGESKAMWIPDLLMFALLLTLELLGAVIKPFALCLRLFANMIAGHIVLAVLILLIMAMPLAMRFTIGLPLAILHLGIQMLELFVAFLQAYIFTFLTTLFLASAVAPEH